MLTVSYSKKNLSIVCFLVVCVVTLIPEHAHAGYLDPGSGSTAVQWIVAGIAVVGRAKRRFFDAVSKIFGR